MIADPRSLLSKYGLRAKKSWGQNFLVDTRIHDAIVTATVRAPDDWVVEIGAGLGTLTARLVEAASAGKVIAIERDRDLAEILRKELAAPNLELAEENALTFDFAAASARAGKPIAVVGNLPYQIATPLIFHVLEARSRVSRIVIMLQKEMGDRIVAAPGTPEYGALGVMLSTYTQPRIVVKARAGAFHPAPRVDSVVLELTPLPTTRAPISDEKRYSRVVHAAFSQRRKTLRNSLKSIASPEAVDRALATAGVDGQRRGETLSVEEFARVAEALEETHA